MSLQTFGTQSLFTTAPAILNPTTGTNVLTVNTSRNKFIVQNLGTNPLYVRFGDNASVTAFHIVLKACAVAADGTGGSYESGSVVWQGDVSVAGISPSLTILEM